MAIGQSATTPTTSDIFACFGPPTHTTGTCSDASLSCASLPTNDTIACVPVPHETYMIRNADTGGAITMEDGLLTLKMPVGTRGGWHWHCVERAGGWLGFREAVSGKHLGRDGKGGFQAQFNHFDDWESFCLRPLGEGRYHLLVLRKEKTCYLRRIGVADASKLVEVEAAAKATRWEFVKV
ncbi:hypothetical protein F5Y14DRAFT_464007 [Nemania sp. NC0429]|nr:hypothetical protein F5Y14DRAFT_464007 [Nemania sp. NC0429]